MYLKRLVVEMSGALLLCASTGIATAHDNKPHDTADQTPTHQAHETPESEPKVPRKLSDSSVTVIECTLGQGPAETIVVSQSQTIRLVLHAPAGVELHLHGYDLSGTAADGAPVVMAFHADHAGRFPIEAHGVQDLLGRTDSALAYIEVRPD
jgi:FtsP/CotA-like multicopper oxidase with cupredoxin domain